MKTLRVICLLLILLLVFLQIKISISNTDYRNTEYMNMKNFLLSATNIAESLKEKITIKEEEINNLKKEIKKRKAENLILNQNYSKLGVNKEKIIDKKSDMLEDLKKGIKDVFSIVNEVNTGDIHRKKRKILKKVDNKIDQMKGEIFNFISDEEVYKKKLILREKKIESINIKLEEYNIDNQKMVDLINEMNEEKGKHLLYIKSIKENIKKNNRLINEFNKEKIKYKVKVTELTGTAGKLKEERDSFADKFKSLEEQNKSFVKKNEWLKKTREDKDKLILVKEEKIKLLENDISVLNKMYEKLKEEKKLTDKNIVEMESLIVRRADKIIELQENSEDKERLILEEKNKINSQLREIVLLRRDVVMGKLENAAFAEKIKQFTNQIKENFEKTSAILNSESKKDMTDSHRIGKHSELLENKEVTVEIMSADLAGSEILR